MPTLNWIGKDKVVNHHLDVPFKILEHSYGFDNGVQSENETESGNKIIHGDNLEALKALLPEYEGRINCIYIDPPYNTGNENWVYNDNVNDPKIKKWLHEVVGREGEDLSRHDKWLCMMYPRLKLLHKLLHEEGFIGISIDDNELFTLGLLMNEIFGSNKRLACIPVKAEPSGGKGKDALRIGHEYLLVYCKGNTQGLKLETSEIRGIVLKDRWGEFVKGRELSKWGSESLRQDREDMWYPLIAPDGTEVYPYRNDGKEGRWRWGKKNPKIIEILKNPEYAQWEKRQFDAGIVINGQFERWFPFEKIREKEKNFGWNTWLDSIGFNSIGTKQIKEIFEDKIFDTPKPTSLIEWVINLMKYSNGIILDSFAGSGTTAHAVLNLNKKDNGNRKFILVQIDETNKKGELINIAETITAERVRRVIKGYGDTEDTEDGFDFYELGQPIFKSNHNLNEEIPDDKIRNYIYYTETKQPLTRQRNKENWYLLDTFQDTGYYFYYEKDKLTTLDLDTLNIVTEKAEQYLIYADICLLDSDYMTSNNIIFKKIPRDIKRF